jgi:hypothetical protein
MVQRIKTGMIADDAVTAAKLSPDAENISVFRNRIINGAMVIDQRNAGAAVTPAAGTFTVDRWAADMTQGSKFSFQQNAGSVTPPAGFSNYLGITSTSAYSVLTGDTFLIRQIIEGFNIADLGWGTANAKTVTLSFWVRSSLTGTFGGALTNGAATFRSYPFSYTISSANTWEQKSITIAGDTTGTWATNNTSGLSVRFGLGSGATFSGTAGAWATGNFAQPTGTTSIVGTSGATFYITGVQLEVGTQATSFEYRQFGTELNLCQRYYYTTGNMANPTGTGGGFFGMPLAVSLAFGQGNTSFRTTMRAVPTITLFDGNGVSGSVTQHGVADNIPSTAGGISQNGFMQVQRASGSFSNSNAPITGGYTASIEL